LAALYPTEQQLSRGVSTSQGDHRAQLAVVMNSHEGLLYTKKYGLIYFNYSSSCYFPPGTNHPSNILEMVGTQVNVNVVRSLFHTEVFDKRKGTPTEWPMLHRSIAFEAYSAFIGKKPDQASLKSGHQMVLGEWRHAQGPLPRLVGGNIEKFMALIQGSEGIENPVQATSTSSQEFAQKRSEPYVNKSTAAINKTADAWTEFRQALLALKPSKERLQSIHPDGSYYHGSVVITMNDKEGLLHHKNLGLIYFHLNNCYVSRDERAASMEDMREKKVTIVVVRSTFHECIALEAILVYIGKSQPSAVQKRGTCGAWLNSKGPAPKLVEEHAQKIRDLIQERSKSSEKKAAQVATPSTTKPGVKTKSKSVQVNFPPSLEECRRIVMEADEKMRREQVKETNKMADEESKRLCKQEEEKRQALLVVSNLTNEDFERLQPVGNDDDDDDLNEKFGVLCL